MAWLLRGGLESKGGGMMNEARTSDSEWKSHYTLIRACSVLNQAWAKHRVAWATCEFRNKRVDGRV